MNRIIPRASSLAVLLLAAIGAAPSRADTLLATNASWQVTAAAPGAGWNSGAGFDASSWQTATTLYNVADYLGPGYSAQGIWSSGGQFSTTETTVWARQIWHLDALPVNASLTAGFDDDGDIWINGVLVGGSHNGFADNVAITAADLTPYLHLGDNVVAYSGTDNYEVWGYNHSSWLQIDGQPGVTAPVPEPETYALMLAGLAGMSLVMRRRSQQR